MEDDYDIDPITGKLIQKPKQEQAFIQTTFNKKLLYTKDEINALFASFTPPSSGGGAVYEYTGDYDNTGTYIYIGYKEAAGAWYIYRRNVSSGARLYATGSSNYTTNWSNRASLTYS